MRAIQPPGAVPALRPAGSPVARLRTGRDSTGVRGEPRA